MSTTLIVIISLLITTIAFILMIHSSPTIESVVLDKSTVRDNLIQNEGYVPYCGSELCKPRTATSPDRWPRTHFNGDQFVCPKCGWESNFPDDFIQKYKERWDK